MRVEIYLELLATIIFLGAILTTAILTRNSTRLRKNFFRGLTYFIGLPLFLLSSSLIGAPSPPKPLELSKPSEAADVEIVRIDLRAYSEEMEVYLETQRFLFTLDLFTTFTLAVLPGVIFAYNYMRRLERDGSKDDDKIF